MASESELRLNCSQLFLSCIIRIYARRLCKDYSRMAVPFCICIMFWIWNIWAWFIAMPLFLRIHIALPFSHWRWKPCCFEYLFTLVKLWSIPVAKLVGSRIRIRIQCPRCPIWSERGGSRVYNWYQGSLSFLVQTISRAHDMFIPQYLLMYT